MRSWNVDSAKCRGDGLCVAECPLSILEMKPGSKQPAPKPGAEAMCVQCGHCVAVCPAGALALDSMRPEDCLPMQPDRGLDPVAAEYFLRNRRSVRTYLDKPVAPADLACLLDMARYAPSGGNSQQLKWLVIHRRERVREIAGEVIAMMRHGSEANREVSERYGWPELVAAWDAGKDTVLRGAPALLVACAPEHYGMAGVDAAIALTYVDLAAPSLGLGTCWAGFLMLAIPQWPPLQKLLALPEGQRCYGAMMVGYPKTRFHRLPTRKPANVAWCG